MMYKNARYFLNTRIKLLDCTLRDGGYINDWKWGNKTMKNIIRLIGNSGIDYLEVGFLRNIEDYDKQVNISRRIEDLNLLIQDKQPGVTYTAMAMCSNYDIENLAPYSGEGIHMIRITAHDYDLDEGLVFAAKVKELGYKISFNPINIMGYDDQEILTIIQKINGIVPDNFAIVDTFGSMKRRDLDRLVSIVDHNMDKNIGLGLHLHENMALSFSLAQTFIDKHLKREIAIDASLLGIGRVPGNLPLELISDYINEYHDHEYDLDPLMDAIQEYIEPIKVSKDWGYSPVYFLSAMYNLHRNYAEHYSTKGDLSVKDIKSLLSRIIKTKKTVFDINYADDLYLDYLDNRIDDRVARLDLKNELINKKILVLAPGASLRKQKEKIQRFIEEEQPVVITVNFTTDEFPVEYAFFGNIKRYSVFDKNNCKVIATSNIVNKNIDYLVDYHQVLDVNNQGGNCLLLFLNLLKQLDLRDVTLAGADGYDNTDENYYDVFIHDFSGRGRQFNSEFGTLLKSIGMNIVFLTKSAYENYC